MFGLDAGSDSGHVLMPHHPAGAQSSAKTRNVGKEGVGIEAWTHSKLDHI